MASRKTSPSRRSLLQAGLLSASAGASRAVAQPPTKSTARSARVLALIGDRYHNADYIRVSLDRLFGELRLPVDYTIAYDDLSAELLSGYQLFVCFRDGMIWPGGYLGPDAYAAYERHLENAADFPQAKPVNWITGEQGRAIEDFVRAGNGFYSLHNNSHVSLSSPAFRRVMGGAYIGHPPLRPFQVRVVKQDHPITRGVEPFMVNDEQHFVVYDKDPGNILLEAVNIDGLRYGKHGAKSISGWAHEYGRGRVVFTAVGHTVHAMWAPQYLKLQRQAVQWLLKRS